MCKIYIITYILRVYVCLGYQFVMPIFKQIRSGALFFPWAEIATYFVRGVEVIHMYFIARQKSAKAWLRKHLNRQLRVSCLISWSGPFRAFRNPTVRSASRVYPTRESGSRFRVLRRCALNPVKRPTMSPCRATGYAC